MTLRVSIVIITIIVTLSQSQLYPLTLRASIIIITITVTLSQSQLYPSTLRASLFDADDPQVLGKVLSDCPIFDDLEYLVEIFAQRYEEFFMVRAKVT